MGNNTEDNDVTQAFPLLNWQALYDFREEQLEQLLQQQSSPPESLLAMARELVSTPYETMDVGQQSVSPNKANSDANIVSIVDRRAEQQQKQGSSSFRDTLGVVLSKFRDGVEYQSQYFPQAAADGNALEKKKIALLSDGGAEVLLTILTDDCDNTKSKVSIKLVDTSLYEAYEDRQLNVHIGSQRLITLTLTDGVGRTSCPLIPLGDLIKVTEIKVDND